MRQDHSSEPITNAQTPGGRLLGEKEAGKLIVKHCLKVNKIHWGILEHAHLTFGLYGFPRYAILQLRTHRNSTWDVQSMRETGESLIESGRILTERLSKTSIFQRLFPNDKVLCDIMEDQVYQQFAAEFLHADHQTIIDLGWQLVAYYEQSLKKGFRYENARGLVGDNVRCNAHVTLNLRHLLHWGSVRLGGDAQYVTRQIVELMLLKANDIHPQIIGWFYEQKPKRLTLSP
jgi:thymidylate synthase (FAD)